MTDKILRADLTAIGYIQSCTFKEQVNTAECLRFGAAVARSIEFTVFGTQSDAPAVGEVLTYYQTDENGVDTLIGTFIAQPSIPGKNTFTVVAYDNISLLETDFSAHLETIQSNFPMTLSSLLTEVATVAGVTFGNSPTMASMTVEEFSVSGVSCRDVVSWAAELSGQYVYCDTNGDIMFGWYSAVSNKKVYKTSGSSGGVTYVPYRQDGLAYKDFAVSAVDAVAVFPANVEGAAVIYPNTTGNTYSLTNNLLLSGASTATLNSVAQTLYTVLSALSAYRPCTINLFRFDNPFRAGDIIQVEDAQGVTFTTMVMSMTVTMDGARIECTGRETYDADKGSTVSNRLVNLANNIVRIDKLKVDWADINTAIINYLTTNNVTAQNLTIVDAADNVLATFNASGITLGDPNSGHMELDFNSLELFDQNQNKYLSIGDLRDANGEAEIDSTQTLADGVITDNVDLIPPTSNTSTAKVYVNGVQDTGATFATNYVHLSSTAYGGDVIRLKYKTTTPTYHYDLGQRASGSTIGFRSVANGKDATSSNAYSTVSGGNTNRATGVGSTVGGGANNVAGNGNYSTVVGGADNTASGYFSTAMGWGNNVTSNAGTAFGKFNVAGNYAETVGGGTNNNNRANIRTLDWSGNEVLAGGLTINGTQVIVADYKIYDSVTDLGLTSGSATIAGVWSAMTSFPAMLITNITEFAPSERKATGTIAIVKKSAAYGYIQLFSASSTVPDYRMHITSSAPTGTWVTVGDEYGGNATSGYVKYANGTMIAWKAVTKSNVAITTAWGSVYESSAAQSLGNWATAFSATPFVFASCGNGNVAVFPEKVTSVSATSAGSCYVWRPQSTASASFVINVVGIGKWY